MGGMDGLCGQRCSICGARTAQHHNIDVGTVGQYDNGRYRYRTACDGCFLIFERAKKDGLRGAPPAEASEAYLAGYAVGRWESTP